MNFATNDCIAVCSPGAVLTVSLLMERITLLPAQSSGDEGRAFLRSDEVYDMLIRPENRDIERLLFVSPHVLFELPNLEGSLSRAWCQEPICHGGSGNWHYPVPPVSEGSSIKVTLHILSGEPSKRTFKTFEGSESQGRLLFPNRLRTPEVLGLLSGSGRTVMEYIFDKPVKQGEQKWLRLHLKPPRLNAPGEVEVWREGCKCCPQTDYIQLLDILGSDTMLASFQDHLYNLSEPDSVPAPLREQVTPQISRGAQVLRQYVFSEGFECPGTYTRLEDQRIFLLPKGCRVDIKLSEGSVRFEGYPKVEVSGRTSTCFCWAAGLRDFADVDPIAVAVALNDYVREFAHDRQTAKSKAYLVVATGVDYSLGCSVIDKLRELAVFASLDNESYFCGSKDFPVDEKERWRLLVDLAFQISLEFMLTKAHFRILYEAQWRAGYSMPARIPKVAKTRRTRTA